jgi:hypothetical protein
MQQPDILALKRGDASVTRTVMSELVISISFQSRSVYGAHERHIYQSSGAA